MGKQSLVAVVAALIASAGLAFAMLVVTTGDSGRSVLIATSLVGEEDGWVFTVGGEGTLLEGPMTLPDGKVIHWKCGVEKWWCVPLEIKDGACTVAPGPDYDFPEANRTYRCPEGIASPIPAETLSAWGDP